MQSRASRSPSVDRRRRGRGGGGESAALGRGRKKERGKKGERVAADAFYGGAAERNGAGGSGVGTAWREETGERERAPGTTGDSSGGRQRPPAGGRGQCRCHAIGEGGGVRATRHEGG
jgi:hypothetical protein